MSDPTIGGVSKRTSNEVLPIAAPESRFSHVIKHLHSARERWDMIVEDLPIDLLMEAERAGCDRDEMRHKVAGYFSVCDGCRAHILQDHDRYYEPAYLHAVESGGNCGSVGQAPAVPDAIFIVGQNGVYTVLKPTRSSGPGPRLKQLSVVTAYRIRPRVPSGCNLVAQDFLDAALDKLQDKTDWKLGASFAGTEKGGYR